jgi:hypothetical protein
MCKIEGFNGNGIKAEEKNDALVIMVDNLCWKRVDKRIKI